MASTLNADNGSLSGSSGLKGSGDASGVLALQTNGTTALTIDTSQNVGIGTSSPTALLQVGDGTGSKLALIKGGTSGTNGGSAIVVQNGGTSNIGIGNYSAINGGAYNSFPVLWFQQGLAFFDNATERMRIDSSGNVGVGVTPTTCNGGTLFQVSLVSNLLGTSNTMYLQNNATYNSGWKYITSSYATQYIQINGQHIWSTAPSGTAGNAITFTQAMTLNANGNLALQGGTTTANGVGITFPASQSASSDANCLDDYEEGTWTPTSGGTAGITMGSIANAVYTKIGRMVHAYAYFQMTSTGVAGASWGGLPFAAQSYAPATRYYSNGGAVFGGNCYVEIGATFFRDNGSLPAGTYGVMVSATYFV